jgi:hypothetical protein
LALKNQPYAGAGTGYGGNTIDPYKKPVTPTKGNAVGGYMAMGLNTLGEAGVEGVTGDGYVVNNYDMRTNYHLDAHYPQYQDPHSARNDMIGMTLMHNTGAAKWAR